MRVNTNAVLPLSGGDTDQVFNTKGGIHHAASVVQNLRAIGEDALHLIPGDRIAQLEFANNPKSFGMFLGLFALGSIEDLAEIVAFPFMLLKNLWDIVENLAAWVINAVQGISDGDAKAVAGFEFGDAPSAVNQLIGLDREQLREAYFVNFFPRWQQPGTAAQGLGKVDLSTIRASVPTPAIKMPTHAPFDAGYWQSLAKLSGKPIAYSPEVVHYDTNQVDADYARRIALIKSAQSTVLYTCYCMEPDKYGEGILQALIDKAKDFKAQGKKPNLMLKFDAVAETFIINEGGAANTQKFLDMLHEFTAAGGSICNYAPLDIQGQNVGGGDHGKALLIDGERAMVGGRNCGGDDFDGHAGDSDIEISGTAASQIGERAMTLLSQLAAGPPQEFGEAPADQLKNAVARYQAFQKQLQIDVTLATNRANAHANAKIAAGKSPGTPLCVLTFSPTFEEIKSPDGVQNAITEAMIQTIDKCQKGDEFIVGQNYINAGDTEMNALINAAKRGVVVKIITNGAAVSERSMLPYYNAERWYGDLLKAGVKIYETDAWQHRKMFCVNGKVAGVGSYNQELAAEEKLSEDMVVSADPTYVAHMHQTLLDEITQKTTLYDPNNAPKMHLSWWQYPFFPFIWMFNETLVLIAFLMRKLM